MQVCTAIARSVTVVLLMILAGSGIAQQNYPSKPIRFIVPFPPGGSTDPLARLAGQRMAESWGQQVLIDNRPGGSTIIGTEAVAKAAPDGYTIVVANTASHSLGKIANPKLPYNPVTDFKSIIEFAMPPTRRDLA